MLDRVGLVHGSLSGRERRYEVDEAQLGRAVAQLASVGATWDARLNRIKRIAEAIELPAQPGRLTLTTRIAVTHVAALMNRARIRAPSQGKRY